jgi:hypothetical protein
MAWRGWANIQASNRNDHPAGMTPKTDPFRSHDSIAIAKGKAMSQNTPIPSSTDKVTIDELATLAQTLNSEADGLNTTIQTINEKLRAANLEVEAWCKGSDGDYGWAFVEGTWQLATQWDGVDFDGDPSKIRRALAKQSRDECIEGFELLEEIYKKLKSVAGGKITAIQKAKQFAASL